MIERRHLQQNVCEHGNKRGSSNRSKHTGHVKVSSNDGIYKKKEEGTNRILNTNPGEKEMNR
jgi:hypothetical protein